MTAGINDPVHYVLVTAAYNEEALLENTILSVVHQTVRPKAWIIVNDGSADNTEAIARRFATSFSFIHVLSLTRKPGRTFGAKVRAVREGFERMRSLEWDYIGNLDADLTFEPTYFERLLARFQMEPALGIAGGWIHEKFGGQFNARPWNRVNCVPHGVQMLRRQCYRDIGDYMVLPFGGEDTYAEVSASMAGWRTRSFAELPVCHHRQTASAGGQLWNRVRQGMLDHSLGYDPVFELLKCVSRFREAPYVLGGMTRLVSFAYASVFRRDRPVPPAFVEYLRERQRERLRGLLRLQRQSGRSLDTVHNP